MPHADPSTLDRRAFLSRVILAGMGTTLLPGLSGCKTSEVQLDFTGSGAPPYKVWEEVLHYLESSPDYIAGRMERLVAAGNAEAMFNFVRDEIQLVPASSRSVGNLNAERWGRRYVLRSGSATPREKAELLQEMYQKAGIPSKLVVESSAISPDEAGGFFLRSTERAFAPEISEAMIRRWARELKNNELQPGIPLLKDEAREAEQLARRVLKALDLPNDHGYGTFDFRWASATPTVEFELEGETRYAHLFDPDVPFGLLRKPESSSVRQISDLQTNTDTVEIKVSYRDSITPSIERELVKGEWKVTDLVGRQVDLNFPTDLSLDEMAVTEVGNARTFIPALSLQAIDESPEYMAERTFIGDPVTLDAKRIRPGGPGESTRIGDHPLLEKPRPDLQASVAEISCTAKAAGYPGVELSVTPTDAEGNLVEGLSAADFSITEDGNPVRALMETNQRTPRILIMSDASSSMPLAFRGAGMDAFRERLEADILAEYPAARITHWTTPSMLYTWLLKGSQTAHDLIIFATDGHNGDELNPADEAIYRAGPPAIILDVVGSAYYVETFETMAELTNGIHLPAMDHDAALAGIHQLLGEIEIAPYTFSYYSGGSAIERNVTVSVDENRVSGDADYKFDSNAGSIMGPRIIGLYLEIKAPRDYPVYRTLAGWQKDIRPGATPDMAMADEVNDYMFGGSQIYFEGTGPTYSAALADILKARLSSREMGEAVLRDDQETAKEAFGKGMFTVSGDALTLMQPVSSSGTDTSLTVPGGIRIGIESFRPGFMTGRRLSTFDFLPTSNYLTLAADPKEAFVTTLEKTAQLAIRESRLFRTSTVSDLDEADWISLLEARSTQWFSQEAVVADSYYWRERIDRGAQYRIMDRSASSKSFWDVDGSFGELYGILPSGIGGGSNEDPSDEKRRAQLMAAFSGLLAVMGKYKIIGAIAGFSFGVIMAYGELLVKLYAIASQAIMIMDASFVNKEIAAAMQSFACSVAKEIIFATTGGIGEVMGGTEVLVGLMTGKAVFEC